jgi:membrane-associated phospholipid phosphatase
VQPPSSTTPLLGIARWVSIAAHPFVTALVLAAAVEMERGTAVAARTATVIGGLFVLPVAVLTVVQVRRGSWSTVDASHPRDRPLLFGVGSAGLVAVLFYFARAEPGTPLAAGAVVVLAMLGVCAAITPWLKVSMHMAAAALAATVLLARGLPVGGLLGAVLPVLAWSRVALGRHRWSEVAAGLVIGGAAGVVVAWLR